MQVETVPSSINVSDLVAPLSRLTGYPVHDIALEACHPLSGGLGVNLGVWRLGGIAEADATTIPWKLVLKGWAPRPEGNDDHA